MFDDDDIRARLTSYLRREAERETGRGAGCLDIVAAYAKLPQYVLQEIVDGERSIDREVVDALMSRIPPNDLFSDDDVRDYIRHHADNGRLEELADAAGLAFEPPAFMEIVNNKDEPVNKLVRAQVVNVMGVI